MTAGASATAAPTVPARHAHPLPWPYQPRVLSRGEITSREIFVFYSPRNDRVVTVSDYLHLALALQLEFTPTITAYIERPRPMALTPRHKIDLAFWTRHKTGQERFLLAIPKEGTVGNARDGIALRDRARMDIAAERHGIELTYVLEQDLVAASAQLRTYFLLLSHVQSVRRVSARATIRQGVLAHFQVTPRTSFQQLISALHGFSQDHVIAVVASLIHAGCIRIADVRPLSLNSMLEAAHDA